MNIWLAIFKFLKLVLEENVEIAVNGGAITIFLSIPISFIKGKNFKRNFSVSAQFMCIFQFPAITVFLTKYINQEKYPSIT